MHWAVAALWAILGSALVVGLDFWAVINRTGDFPWKGEEKIRTVAYVCGFVARALSGGVIGAAFGDSGLVTNAVTALMLGAAAPLIAEKLTKAGVELAPGSQQ